MKPLITILFALSLGGCSGRWVYMDDCYEYRKALIREDGREIDLLLEVDSLQNEIDELKSHQFETIPSPRQREHYWKNYQDTTLTPFFFNYETNPCRIRIDSFGVILDSAEVATDKQFDNFGMYKSFLKQQMKKDADEVR